MELNLKLDIANIARPLLSIFEMASNGRKVMFSEGESDMQLKGSNQTITPEKKADSLCWIYGSPPEIARSSPFVRHVAKA